MGIFFFNDTKGKYVCLLYRNILIFKYKNLERNYYYRTKHADFDLKFKLNSNLIKLKTMKSKQNQSSLFKKNQK